MSGTQLIDAAEEGNKDELQRLLIEERIDPNYILNDGLTPLIVACTNGRLDLVELLIAAGANVNLATKNCDAPIINAAANSHFHVVRFLASKRADSNVKSYHCGSYLENEVFVLPSYKTPLHYAVAKGDVETIHDLAFYNQNLDLDAEDRYGKTPARFAEECNQKYAATVLDSLKESKIRKMQREAEQRKQKQPQPKINRNQLNALNTLSNLNISNLHQLPTVGSTNTNNSSYSTAELLSNSSGYVGKALKKKSTTEETQNSDSLPIFDCDYDGNNPSITNILGKKN